jgi:outer membrane protein assembly factor BamB
MKHYVLFLLLILFLLGSPMASEVKKLDNKITDKTDMIILEKDANVTGTWDTYVDFTGADPTLYMGKLVLVQSGSQVEVTYGIEGMSANGEVSGDTLNITASAENVTMLISGEVNPENTLVSGDMSCSGGSCPFSQARFKLEKYSDSTQVPHMDIPVNDIKIDGNTSDWASVNVMIKDQTGEANLTLPGSDIEYVKIAVNKAKARLFVLIKIASGVVNPDLVYSVKLINNVVKYITGLDIVYEDGWQIKGHNEITHEPIDVYGEVQTGGQYIEAGAYLSLLNLPKEFAWNTNTYEKNGFTGQDMSSFFGYLKKPGQITSFITGTWDVFLGPKDDLARNFWGKMVFEQTDQQVAISYGLDVDENGGGAIVENSVKFKITGSNGTIEMAGTLKGDRLIGACKQCPSTSVDCRDQAIYYSLEMRKYSASTTVPVSEIPIIDPSVVVDGDPKDWASGEIYMPDQRGEQLATLQGVDIEFVKLCSNMERSRLFAFIKIVSTLNKPGEINPDVIYRLSFTSRDPRFNKYIEAKFDINSWILNGYDAISGQKLHLNPELAVKKNYLELKVDFNALKLPANFLVKTQTYAKALGRGQNCDEVRRFGYSYVTNILSPRINWRFHAEKPVYYSSPAVDSRGIIYFGTGMYIETTFGSIYALYPDGTLKWKHKLEYNGYSPVVGTDGTIYIQDSNSILYAFDQSGKLKWKYGDNQVASEVGHRVPVIGGNGTIYMGGRYLDAVKTDGTRKWRADLRGFVSASPIVLQDESIIAIHGGGTETLHKINASDGSTIWEFRIEFEHECFNAFSAPAVDSNGIIYFGTETDCPLYGGWLYSVKPDGTLNWRTFIEGYELTSSPTISSDGTIYIGTRKGKDNRILAINPSGSLKWEYIITQVHGSDDIYCSPTIGADGTIYFGAENGLLHALNPDGSEQWRESLAGFNWSSPAILADGTLYIGGCYQGGFLYSVKTESRGLANSAWPKFHKNNRNTGRYNDQF